MTDKYDAIREFLENLPDTFENLEEGIDIQTQMEYVDYSHSFDHGELSDSETMKLGNMLHDTRISIDIRKKALVLLAHLGTITAFRQIENYSREPGNELKQWTTLALQECKMILECSLTDQSTGFISTGLGGYQDKFRYYFFVLPSSGEPFSATQKNIIQEEFKLISCDLKCTVETVDLADMYVGLIVLVPMDIAVGTFIEAGIQKCNELGDFVLDDYYVTNQEIPDESEIPDIIKKVKE
jgi:hypothetical protein